jgi:hypothetical protein
MALRAPLEAGDPTTMTARRKRTGKDGKMSKRWRSTWLRALALGGVAAGLLAVAGPASARSTGLTVYNLTGHTMTLTQTRWIGEPEIPRDSPQPGLVLKPGGAPVHVELLYSLSKASSVELVFKSTVGIHSGVAKISDNPTKAHCTGAYPGTCTVNKANDTVTFLDPPGTVHNIPAGEGQEQSKVLQELCTKHSSAKCDFKPTKKTPVQGAAQVVPDPIVNCSDTEPLNESITWEHRVGMTHSTGLEVSSGFEYEFLKAKVSASITATYGFEYSDARTFSRQFTRVIPPGYIAWVEHAAPLTRYTGDFTLHLGNTTWNLTGIHTDYPDKDPAKTGSWRVFNQKLTPDQLHRACGNSDGLASVGLSFVHDKPIH